MFFNFNVYGFWQNIKKKHFTNGAFFRIVAVRIFSIFRISIHIFIIQTKGLVCCLATEGLVARQNLKYLII
jgi:hypothetical protein